MAVDREDRHNEFLKLLHMSPDMATHTYNRNYDRIGQWFQVPLPALSLTLFVERWREEIEDAYRMGVEEDEAAAQDNDTLSLNDHMELASTSKPRPTPTKKGTSCSVFNGSTTYSSRHLSTRPEAKESGRQERER